MMLVQRSALLLLFSIAVCSAGPVSISFTSLPAVYENGSYNGFAIATVDGTPDQMLVCDDSGHITYMPSGILSYEFSSLVGPDPLQYARFVASPGSPTPIEVQRYEEAAVLVWELTAAGSAPDAVTDYQYVLWNLFDPTTTLFRPNQLQIQSDALNIVLGNVTAPVWLSTAYAELEIYTPTGAAVSNQEFLGLDPPADAPEPRTAWSLALAACVLGVVARIRRRQDQPARG